MKLKAKHFGLTLNGEIANITSEHNGLFYGYIKNQRPGEEIDLTDIVWDGNGKSIDPYNNPQNNENKCDECEELDVEDLDECLDNLFNDEGFLDVAQSIIDLKEAIDKQVKMPLPPDEHGVKDFNEYHFSLIACMRYVDFSDFDPPISEPGINGTN